MEYNIINQNGGELDIHDSSQFHPDIDHIVFTNSFEESLLNAVDPSDVLLPDHLDVAKLRYRRPPDRNVMLGPWNFVVEINSLHTDMKKYRYSHKLNRIYVDMNTDFSVQFNWNGSECMHVRAMVVFADASQAEKRVERCTSHYHENVTTVSPTVAKNVLHSSRVSTNTGDVQYCGDASDPHSWLSVRVALSKPGPDLPATHAFRFKCKNSCTSGINRRAILIIFTLEDLVGNVYGRQLVGARACACPRRDMIRDEAAEGAPAGKRRLTEPPPHAPPAKVKVEECDEAIVHLPELQLMSPSAAVLGLEAMIKMEEQALESRTGKTKETAVRLIASLKQTQDDLKRRHRLQ